MRGFKFFVSVFERAFRSDEAFRISRSNRAYNFFSNEYPNDISKDSEGNILMSGVRCAKSKVVRDFDGSERTTRVIPKSSPSYDYFACEYRQNTPTQDAFGNFILSDEIVKVKTRLKWEIISLFILCVDKYMF